MPTNTTATVTQTIDAPLATVAADLANAANHPEWATEFFDGPAKPSDDGAVHVTVPMMGGPARMRIDADIEKGILDLHLPQATPLSATRYRFA